MKAVDGIDTVESPRRNQALSAADGRFFFRGLTNKDDRPRKVVLDPTQHLGGSEENAHVPVMAAGMHLAGKLRIKGQSRFFRHRQGVHIGPQGDDRSGLSPFQIAQNGRRTGDMLRNFYAE